MTHSGFVLVGGRSSRMGRDKALLPYHGSTLAGYVATQVREAAGEATLIGDPTRYAGLGYPVVPDSVEGCGPLGGVTTALRITEAEWNLIVACDMPGISAEFLGHILRAAKGSGHACLVPVGRSGRAEPLCAVYHRDCLAELQRALDSKLLKMQTVVESLRPRYWTFPEFGWEFGNQPRPFENVNTPEDWASVETAETKQG